VTDVLFPRLSDQDPDGEGVVATWFVDDGATLTVGQLIAEVAVDKVDAEVFAPADGVLSIFVAEGRAAAQGSVIGTIA
jgi:pyruvate/2-oxoglutarate dehydrogenase complex dihydrolipoamide acyltransferase (E2) component